MSDIIEILGEKKFFGSRNNELKTRVIFDGDSKIKYENNLFFDISQQDQFIKEKRESNLFRLYGKISPVANFSLYKKTIDSYIPWTVNESLFEFNNQNWSVVVLKSKRIELGFDQNGKPITTKGLKIFEKYLDNDPSKEIVFNVNFKQGLPAKYFESVVYPDNFGFLFPFGHNFSVGDKMRITSNNLFLLESGLYDVAIVDGNRVFIDEKPYINYNQKVFVDPNAQVTKMKDYKDAADNNNLADELAEQKNINGLLFSPLTASQLSNNLRPNPIPLINPDFYIAKVVEKEVLEYYIKLLEVIDVFDDVDICGFSINNYKNDNFNFILNKDLDINGYLNNLNEPLSDLYIGIIKNGGENENDFGKVESHLSNFIEFINEGYGLEQITDNVFLGKKPKKGDLFFHSLCEHTTENLTETEINYFHHKFIHNDVLFYYKPFNKINLKLKSVYIEDTDNVNVKPEYAIYSKQSEKYIWRDIFDIGVTDEDGNVIDFPFMNGSFYIYNDLNFHLISEKNYTKKYELNKNDITTTGNSLINEINDLLGNLDEENIEEIKPYSKYKDQKC